MTGRDKSFTASATLRRGSAGFTLLEMMLALVIFSGLSMAGIAMVQGGLRSGGQVRTSAETLTALQKTQWLLEQDLGQLAVRTSLNGTRSETLNIERKKKAIIVTFLRHRSWLPGNEGPRSGVVWVQWELKEGVLTRKAWSSDTVSPSQEGISMLENVSHFELSTLTQQGKMGPPHSARVVLASSAFGTLERTFLLGGTL